MQHAEENQYSKFEMRAGQADVPPAVPFLLERLPSLNSLMKAARLANFVSNWRRQD